MSDGRTARGPLYELIRGHFKLERDLDLCAAIYGEDAAQRSQLAQLSQIVTSAAAEEDAAAAELIQQAAGELADLVEAVAAGLQIPPDMSVLVSYTGGMFRMGERLTAPLQSTLQSRSARYILKQPRFPPEIGAALQAARLHQSPLSLASLAELDGAVSHLA
jgi:N-acetylglucosamine kinase-like BadF-type ATPase